MSRRHEDRSQCLSTSQTLVEGGLYYNGEKDFRLYRLVVILRIRRPRNGAGRTEMFMCKVPTSKSANPDS